MQRAIEAAGGFLRNYCGILPSGTDFCGSKICAATLPAQEPRLMFT
jgi:hypothetical protein